MGEMRALTVKQPWAHFITKQGKTIENRTWETDYRGLLAIHAGAYSGWDKGAESDPVAVSTWRLWAGTSSTGEVRTPLTRGEAFSFFTFSAVIAVADLTGCHSGLECSDLNVPPSYCSPWARGGQSHWTLSNVQWLPEPVPCRGKLGLWRLPDDVEKQVREQLEAGDA